MKIINQISFILIFNISYLIIFSFLDLPKRSHEVAIVTGGSRGIGLEVVKKLLECDMHVVIACRKVQAGLDAIETLRKNGVTSGTAEVKPLDTSSLKSVHNFANEITSTCSQLNILINNGMSNFSVFKILSYKKYYYFCLGIILKVKKIL